MGCFDHRLVRCLESINFVALPNGGFFMVMNPMAVKKSPEKTNPIDMSWESFPHMVPVTHSAVHETLRIQICPKNPGLPRSIPIHFGWDWNPQSYLIGRGLDS